MFTALVDNELVNLDPRIPQPVSPTDKRALHTHKPNVRCRGCNGRAHIRLLEDTEDPFMIFAHNAGYGETCKALGYHTDESTEHHHLKSRLAAAARNAGWHTDTEVPGDHCRADVLATHPTTGRTRVLEAQISALSTHDAHERTQRYIDHFRGRVTWTHRGPRTWANRSKDIEAVQVDADSLEIVIAGVASDQTGTTAPPAPIDTVIPRILNRQLRYIFLDTFGFYLDLAAATAHTTQGRRHRQQAIPTSRGHYVQECPEAPELPTAAIPDGRLICAVCGRPFVGRPDPDAGQLLPEICGEIYCRAEHTWIADDWAGAARMANARIEAGIVLNDLDLSALAKVTETPGEA